MAHNSKNGPLAKGLNEGDAASAASIRQWLKRTEHDLALFFQDQDEAAEIPSDYKTLNSLFGVI